MTLFPATFIFLVLAQTFESCIAIPEQDTHSDEFYKMLIANIMSNTKTTDFEHFSLGFCIDHKQCSSNCGVIGGLCKNGFCYCNSKVFEKRQSHLDKGTCNLDYVDKDSPIELATCRSSCQKSCQQGSLCLQRLQLTRNVATCTCHGQSDTEDCSDRPKFQTRIPDFTSWFEILAPWLHAVTKPKLCTAVTNCANFHFKLFVPANGATWAQAYQSCLHEGMQLASVQCSAKYECLLKTIAYGGQPDIVNYWLSGYRIDLTSPQNFVWFTTGDSVPLTLPYWGPSQPNNDHGNESCLSLRKIYPPGFPEQNVYNVADDQCEAQFAYICEKKPFCLN